MYNISAFNFIEKYKLIYYLATHIGYAYVIFRCLLNKDYIKHTYLGFVLLLLVILSDSLFGSRKDGTIFMYILIVSSYNFPFKKVLKTFLFTQATLYILVILSFFSGCFPNTTISALIINHINNHI